MFNHSQKCEYINHKRCTDKVILFVVGQPFFIAFLVVVVVVAGNDKTKYKNIFSHYYETEGSGDGPR